VFRCRDAEAECADYQFNPAIGDELKQSVASVEFRLNGGEFNDEVSFDVNDHGVWSNCTVPLCSTSISPWTTSRHTPGGSPEQSDRTDADRRDAWGERMLYARDPFGNPISFVTRRLYVLGRCLRRACPNFCWRNKAVRSLQRVGKALLRAVPGEAHFARYSRWLNPQVPFVAVRAAPTRPRAFIASSTNSM